MWKVDGYVGLWRELEPFSDDVRAFVVCGDRQMTVPRRWLAPEREEAPEPKPGGHAQSVRGSGLGDLFRRLRPAFPVRRCT
jgi:hypothetical protein